MFPILKHCWRIHCLFRLLRCSQSQNIADVYLVFLHCWAIPNPKTSLMYFLYFYNAEMLAMLNYCRRIPWLFRLLRFSQSWNLVILHCWIVPNFLNLMSHTLSFYIAELFPILKHCWRILCLFRLLRCPNLETLLTYILSYYIAELFLIF